MSRPMIGYLVSLRNPDSPDDGTFAPTASAIAPAASATYIDQFIPNTGSDASTNPYTYLFADTPTAQTWAQKIYNDGQYGKILIFIHGFNNGAAKVLTRHTNIATGLSGAGPQAVTVISFDWPSHNEKPDYPGDHNNAEKSGPLLITDCIDVLVSAGIRQPDINIITHSMGGYVLQNAFSKVAQEPIVNQVMLVQADVLNLAFDDAKNFPQLGAGLLHEQSRSLDCLLER